MIMKINFILYLKIILLKAAQRKRKHLVKVQKIRKLELMIFFEILLILNLFKFTIILNIFINQKSALILSSIKNYLN